MAKKKSKIKFWLWVVIILAIVAASYFGLSGYFTITTNRYEANYSASSGKLLLNSKQKDSVISALQQLKKFGNWPIGTVSLSSGRGNPFQEKIIQEAQ